MDIRIGIVQSMKEIEVELAVDADRDKIMKEVEKALTGDQVLWLTDRRGRRVGVPASRIAYVELGRAAPEMSIQIPVHAPVELAENRGYERGEGPNL